MDELLRRLDAILTETPLAELRVELQTLLVSAYRRGAMDFKRSTDNVMGPLAAQVEQYHAYVAQWKATEADTDRPEEGRSGPSGVRRGHERS